MVKHAKNMAAGRQLSEGLLRRHQIKYITASFRRCFLNINEERTHFGYETISREEKSKRGAHIHILCFVLLII